LRSNNCIEGYNNRLRLQVKYSHPSIGYLIGILINEENHFKSILLKIIAKTLPKFPVPSLSETSKVITPIDSVYQQILSTFSKSEQRRLISYFDEKEFQGLIDLSMQKMQEFEDKILCALFEEDLIEINLQEEDNKK